MIEVQTGVGYGVTLTFASLDPDLAAPDADGRFVVFAYCPNAGHPVDEAHADILEEQCPTGQWITRRSFPFPVRVFTVEKADLPVAYGLLSRIVNDGYMDAPIVGERIMLAAKEEVRYLADRHDLDAEALWECFESLPDQPFYHDDGNLHRACYDEAERIGGMSDD